MLLRFIVVYLITFTIVFTAQTQNESATSFELNEIIYEQDQDGTWYARNPGSQARVQVFLERLLVMDMERSNRWQLPSCPDQALQLAVDLPSAQARYIGFGVSLLSFDSEGDSQLVRQYLEVNFPHLILMFDARIQTSGGVVNDPFWPTLHNFENTDSNCGTVSSGNDWQYNLDVQLPDVWQRVQGRSHTSIVAVIDTGIYTGHEDLGGAFWVNTDEIPDNNIDDDGNGFVDDVNGFNFSNCSGDTDNPVDHGTQIAGVIAANTDNGIGVAGITMHPNGQRFAKIMALTAGSDGTASQAGTLSSYYQAIYYAINNGAEIINASWGFQVDFPLVRLIHRIIEDTSNVLILAAVGNRGFDFADIDFPARYTDTVAVTAVDCFGQYNPDRFQSGAAVDIAAPVSPLTTAAPSNGFHFGNELYESFGGSSSATAHVTGIAAMIRAMNPFLSRVLVREALRQTGIKKGGEVGSNGAVYTGNPPHNPNLGFGLIDSVAAMNFGQTQRAVGNIRVQGERDNGYLIAGDILTITWDSLNLDSSNRISIALVDQHIPNVGDPEDPEDFVSGIPATSGLWSGKLPNIFHTNRTYTLRIQVEGEPAATAYGQSDLKYLDRHFLDLRTAEVPCGSFETTLFWDTSLSVTEGVLLWIETPGGLERVPFRVPFEGYFPVSFESLNGLLDFHGTNPDPNSFHFNLDIWLESVADSSIRTPVKRLRFNQVDCEPVDPHLAEQ